MTITPERKQYIADWTKKNIRRIVGCRVKEAGKFYDEQGKSVIITPYDFLVTKSRLLPFTIYGTDRKVHVPRSLCVRAAIAVNINKGNKVIANSPNMPCINKGPNPRFK